VGSPGLWTTLRAGASAGGAFWQAQPIHNNELQSNQRGMAEQCNRRWSVSPPENPGGTPVKPCRCARRDQAQPQPPSAPVG